MLVSDGPDGAPRRIASRDPIDLNNIPDDRPGFTRWLHQELGLNAAQIAKRTGATASTVRRILKRQPTHSFAAPDATPEQLQEWCDDYVAQVDLTPQKRAAALAWFADLGVRPSGR